MDVVKNSEDINNIFRTVQAETHCPFAKTATITFARAMEAQDTLPQAAQKLFDDMITYVQEGIVAAPDGLAVALPNTVAGDDLDSLIATFNDLYRALKKQDGFDDEALAAEEIEDSGWQLTIAGQRLFTIVFSSLYSADNPRHIAEADTTFIFFQPVQSFHARIPYDKDSIEFRRLKANIRARFAAAGQAYDGSINDNPHEAAKYLSPQHIGMPAVQWWKSDQPTI